MVQTTASSALGLEFGVKKHPCQDGDEEQGGLALTGALTCTLEVHLGHQRPEGFLGGQAAGPPHGGLVGQQIDGGKAFLPRGEVCDVQGEGVTLAIPQGSLPQHQVHPRVAGGRGGFVQDEGLVLKAVSCPPLQGWTRERQERFGLKLKLCP